MHNLINLIPLYLYQGRDLPAPHCLYDYVLARQGLIKRTANFHTEADLLLAQHPANLELPGLHLAHYPLRGIRLRLPRIPGQVLRDILADARQDMGREAMYLVRWDPDRRQYVSDRPVQHATSVHVGYTAAPDARVVLEIHSHNTMPAFFSATDDADEQGGQWYGVIGHIDQANPQLTLRLGMYGHWAYNLPGEMLFDSIGPFENTWLRPPAGQGQSGGSTTKSSWYKFWRR